MSARRLMAHTERQLFAELHGFFLADPELLDAFAAGASRDRDLLRLFSETDAGDRIARDGIAIPVLGLDAGYYSVTLRDEAAPSGIIGHPLASSAGWILRAESRELVLGGIGYLKDWNAEHPKLRRIAVPPGWYSVVIALGPAAGGDDFSLDFALRLCSSRPAFSASLAPTFPSS